MSGHVSLVGAGPGSVDLLTLRAARLLAEAEVVLHDALVDEDALRLATRARRFYVGKRAGRHSLSQEAIQRLMIRLARRDLRVVRLKGGDPFVFGRGGEEALALQAAGISYEVVPGVSAAHAAPALAGIPVTHRGVSAAIVTVAGHDPGTYRPVLERLTPGSATIVAMMGLGQRDRIASVLLDAGWPQDTPAALVLGAATPGAWRWLGTLDALRNVEIPAEVRGAPGTIVIGHCVSLAERLNQMPAAATRHVAS
jgi:uroporphyrin-III C-methyltransferase